MIEYSCVKCRSINRAQDVLNMPANAICPECEILEDLETVETEDKPNWALILDKLDELKQIVKQEMKK